jgi:hypothetical protein
MYQMNDKSLLPHCQKNSVDNNKPTSCKKLCFTLGTFTCVALYYMSKKHRMYALIIFKDIDVLVSSLHAGFRGSGGRQSSTLPPALGSSGR